MLFQINQDGTIELLFFTAQSSTPSTLRVFTSDSGFWCSILPKVVSLIFICSRWQRRSAQRPLIIRKPLFDFFELLERQFPIESTENPLQFKTAQDFANSLAVHVNHLNRSVKEVTGKSTTTHITERIVTEAKALLQHTNWTIAEVAYALGFEYPTYFNNFFKRLTGTNPTALRAQAV